MWQHAVGTLRLPACLRQRETCAAPCWAPQIGSLAACAYMQPGCFPPWLIFAAVSKALLLSVCITDLQLLTIRCSALACVDYCYALSKQASFCLIAAGAVGLCVV
jgi:hypothetical protein